MPSLSRPSLILTFAALLAFAGNSVLCRLALTPDASGAVMAGPLGFTLLRFVSGALLLALLMAGRGVVLQGSWSAGSWRGGVSLLVYGVLFSYAYVSLPAASGALILFASVQATMLCGGFLAGERFTPSQGLGMALALAGLAALFLPSAEQPSILGALAMAVSGIGWGIYSLLGRGKGDPALSTAGHFAKAALILLALALPAFAIFPEPLPKPSGVALGLCAGMITSALGYVMWYKALKSLPALTAAASQLTVPVIAAILGALFLGEALSLRFGVIGGVILLGVGLAIMPKRQI